MNTNENTTPVKRKNDIHAYFIFHENYFPSVAWDDVKDYMLGLNEADFDTFQLIPFKNPSTLFWTAFPLGIFGVDRFVLGEVGLGVVKLLTFGQFFIGFVLDSFTIFDRTRNYNYEWFLQIKLRNQAYLSNY